MRARYTWWPLAPLGFALSGSWSMIVFWFPIFVAWILKSVLLRYGGMKVYMRLKPLFLGLILGEFSQAVLWAAEHLAHPGALLPLALEPNRGSARHGSHRPQSSAPARSLSCLSCSRPDSRRRQLPCTRTTATPSRPSDRAGTRPACLRVG